MQRKILIKSIPFLLALSIAATLISGCTGKEAQTTPESSSAGSSTKAEDTQTASGTTYPIKTDVTLKYYMGLSTGANVTNNGNIQFYQELQKRTGVKLEFIHPPVNQHKEALSMMLASGDLPDIIEYDWYNFPGGPEKAIKDGYLLKLNDYIDKYAPNLKEYLKANPQVDKQVKTDEGSYYVFPFMRGDEILTVYYGPLMRKDWLDELGLKVPATLDEWYTTLKAFKEKKGVEAPLSFTSVPNEGSPFYFSDALIGAFGISKNFYVEDGKVKFGAAQPEFKEFLTLMRKWYSEGLIDKNFATTDDKMLDSDITTGKTGATFGYNGGSLGKWLTAMKDKDPKFDLVAAPYPTLKAGETVKFAQKDFLYTSSGSAAITGKSKNVEIAAKLLDYGYSEEGRMFFNFGTEGLSYKMENGSPVYTELLTNNPEKLSMAQAMSKYIRGNTSGPFIQDKRYIDLYYKTPQQRTALEVWNKSDATKYKLPRVTPTSEESTEYSKIMNEINTLVDENMYKVILGEDSVDNFDKYLEKLKKIGIDKVIEINQNALDRYNKR